MSRAGASTLPSSGRWARSSRPAWPRGSRWAWSSAAATSGAAPRSGAATWSVINSLAVQDVLEQIGQPARVLTSIPMGPVGQITSRAAAEEHFAAGRVVIFAGGTGNPYFSTDTAAVLRAAEIQADMILLAKNIDGVYSADPKKDPNAVKYDSITYDQVLADHLQVMDLTATSLALEHHIPVMIFALADPQNIQRAVMGEKIGTIVEEEKK